MRDRAVAAQIASKSRRRRLERWNQRGQDSGDRGNRNRETKHPNVQAQIQSDRPWNRQLDRKQRLDDRRCDRHSNHRAGKTQHQPLAEHLSNQVRTAGANGKADTDLASTR